MAKYNWQAIRRYYIEHEDCSYADLSAKFGVSETAILYYQKRMDEDWPEMRKKALEKAREMLPDISGERIATFQAEKLKVGKFLIGVGVQGINDHKPRTAREAREIIDSGYKIATEAVGLDKPGVVVNQQTNVLTMDAFVLAMKQRKQAQMEGGQP